jgi:hypothetical protein
MSTHSNGSSAQPPRWRLPQQHEELLRTALRLNKTARAVTSEQRAIINQICSSPEKLTFAPEDFVIAFKLALTNAADDVGIKPGSDRNELLARLVSTCIEEFFRVPSSVDTSRSGKGIRASSPHEITSEASDR